ncbi:MAG: efflux RND transporter permease subunit, partial [Oligoflexales bacterium]|nr:efflux RND transporter permease subunit [Oligoflexales bacterium]
MLLSDVSIKRPVFATMLNLVLIVFGLFALPDLAIDQFPNIDFPFVTVTIVYPGADPQTIEDKILDPLEKAVNGISGLDQIISNAYPSVAQIILKFKLEKNGDLAAQETRDKIFASLSLIPTDAETPIVRKIDISGAPIMNVGINSKDMPFGELSQIVDDIVKPAMERVSGVAGVTVAGLRKKEIHIEINRDQLSSYGLGPQDVATAVKSQNIDIPAGQLTSETKEWSIRLKGKEGSAEAIGSIPLVSATGQTLRIADVALVRETLAEEKTSAFSGKDPMIIMLVQKQAGSDTTSVAAGVRKTVGQLSAQLPKGTQISVISDNSVYIEGSINTVKFDLVLGAVLATLIVFLFLRDIRITIISAVALPTSVIGTFALIKQMGFTLNFMTTMGLSLAIGILIDDAIIVIENIHRHMQMNKDGPSAARDATS